MLNRKQNIKKINYRLKIDFIISYADCKSYKLRKHFVSILYAPFIAASMRCLIVIATSIAEVSVTPQQRDLADECIPERVDNVQNYYSKACHKVTSLLLNPCLPRKLWI